MHLMRFGARFKRHGASRSPSAALQFWTVTHRLRHRLEAYQITEVPRPFRSSTWNDLVYWQLLIDGDDRGIARLAGHNPDAYIPTPEEWFGKVEA